MENNKQELIEHTEIAPFNSVIDHARRIEGMPNKQVTINAMPKFLRFFWFFIIGTMSLGIVLLIISAVFR